MNKNQHIIKSYFWLWTIHSNTQCKTMPKNACHITYCREMASFHNYIFCFYLVFLFSVYYYLLPSVSALAYKFLLWKCTVSYLLLFCSDQTIHTTALIIKIITVFCTGAWKQCLQSKCDVPKKGLFKFWQRGQRISFPGKVLCGGCKYLPYVCGDLCLFV